MNFVIMGGCGISGPRGGGEVFRKNERESGPRMKGRALSIHEVSDRDAGSCARFLSLPPGLVFKEIKLSTGLGHGLFYSPDKVWLDLVTEWANLHLKTAKALGLTIPQSVLIRADKVVE